MSDGDLPGNVDSGGLEAALARALRGEVRFDAGSRALYASDSSNYRQVPIGVVVPRDRDDVLATLELCREFGAPILGRGAGTSLAGQCCNVAVVIDTSKYLRRILEIDPAAKTARVEPGVVLDDLRDAAERHGLTFGPDPATHASCTLGGMIGNNSCGVHSVMAGKTDENVHELEVVTGDGTVLTVGATGEDELARAAAGGGRRAEIYGGLTDLIGRYAPLVRSRYPPIPRCVSGYNLPWLLPENGFNLARALVGSEGTCAFVLQAKVRLVWSPPARVLVVLGFPDVYAAADAVPQLLEHAPIGLEGFDDRLVRDMEKAGLFPENRRLLPEGRGWLLVEMGGAEPEETLAAARRLVAFTGSRPGVNARVFDRREEAGRVWQVRQAALGATAHVPGQPLTWEGWEDSAVSPEKLGAYLRDWRALLDRFGYGGDFYGHFGQGCVHTRTDFDLATREGVAKYRAFVSEAADLVVSYGGSISGEHGDGQSRGELLPKMFGEELIGAFREFKAIWDPRGLMNPGKLVDPFRADENLRQSGPRPHVPTRTAFAYASDAGDLARVLQRCVGVGECRRGKGGTMCPSFMVTREEKHSTRGRARLFDEMLRGEVLTGGWREEAVRDALDLCLACKGCKSDCPVGVDMAAYKAEFLSRYYDGRRRPAAAYSMGLVHRWARLASAAPGLANLAMETPLFSGALKSLAGIAPERRLPRLARQTFRSWFARRNGAARGSGRPVLLFPDTFTNHFHAGVARAAVEVLEAAGLSVEIPPRPLCCGRPLYDSGMLDTARGLLEEVLRAVGPVVEAGAPLLVLEPSCASVFRDELPELFPGDSRAALLSRRTFLLGELLRAEAPDFRPRLPSRRALVQFHCHQRALFGIDEDRRALGRAGLEVEVPDSGCCGMAGAFGFEKSHYAVSLAIGERVILPAVRAASPETVVVADGFSCREQIAGATGRRPLHLAEVLRSAIV